MSVRDHVIEFHRAYGLPIGEKPAISDESRFRLRLRLIAEEFFELLEASLATNQNVINAKALVESAVNASYLAPNLVGIADACADIDYVVEGLRVELGMDGAPVAAEVHRSNMSKLDVDGKPIVRADGKVIKGPNYSPPDIAGALFEQGWSK